MSDDNGKTATAEVEPEAKDLPDDHIFRALPNAGFLNIVTAAGKAKKLKINVLDILVYEEYMKAVEEYQKLNRESVRIENEKDIAEKKGRPYTPTERDAKNTGEKIDLSVKQLQFFVDIERADLAGFSLEVIGELLKYVVTRGASAGKPGDTDDAKKNVSGNGMTSLSLPAGEST